MALHYGWGSYRHFYPLLDWLKVLPSLQYMGLPSHDHRPLLFDSLCFFVQQRRFNRKRRARASRDPNIPGQNFLHNLRCILYGIYNHFDNRLHLLFPPVGPDNLNVKNRVKVLLTNADLNGRGCDDDLHDVFILDDSNQFNDLRSQRIRIQPHRKSLHRGHRKEWSWTDHVLLLSIQRILDTWNLRHHNGFRNFKRHSQVVFPFRTCARYLKTNVENITNDHAISFWKFSVRQSCFVGRAVFGILHGVDILLPFLEIPQKQQLFQSHWRLSTSFFNVDVQSHKTN